jgi:DNA-binding MarR family transcriptional regulator
MEIEKEIYQTKFANEYEKLWINILYTGNWLDSLMSQFLKDFSRELKLTGEQYNVLRILRGQHPHKVTLNVIQERMLDKMSNASRLVEKLKIKTLVERQECSKDRRKVDIWITDKGLEVLQEIDLKLETIQQKARTITLEEAKELNRILDKLRG